MEGTWSAILLMFVSMEDRAKRYFNSGYNCAESVLMVISEELELSNRDAKSLVPRVATGFGGGIARNGETCGALTGGAMAISLALGRDSSEESRDLCYFAVDRFYNDFVKVFGTSKCRDLTGLDLKKTSGTDICRVNVHDEVCNPIVGWASKRAYQMIQGKD